jgi:hypothetical protein
MEEQKEEQKDVELLSNVDVLALQLAKVKKELAVANIETAMAQQESADLAHRYVVLQLYMKYKLKEGDSINENGTIIRKS